MPVGVSVRRDRARFYVHGWLQCLPTAACTTNSNRASSRAREDACLVLILSKAPAALRNQYYFKLQFAILGHISESVVAGARHIECPFLIQVPSV